MSRMVLLGEVFDGDDGHCENSGSDVKVPHLFFVDTWIRIVGGDEEHFDIKSEDDDSGQHLYNFPSLHEVAFSFLCMDRFDTWYGLGIILFW